MRYLLTALTLAVPFLPVTPAAPVPKGEDPPYFPIKVGARWVYEFDGREEHAEFVTAVGVKGKTTTVSVSRELMGRVRPWRQVLVDREGLVEVAVGEEQHVPPYRLLRLPPTPGDGWPLRGHRTVPGSDQMHHVKRGMATVRGVEEVIVPAGTYQAVRVEHVYTLNGDPRRVIYWFAPGVGTVKAVTPDGKPVVLKSFSPGKD